MVCMGPNPFPWWVTILTTALAMAVSAVIAGFAYRHRMNQAWRPMEQDGAGLVLRYGGAMRLGVPIMITVVGVGLVVFVFLTWEGSGDGARWTFIVVGLFSAVVWPMVCMTLWLYRVRIDERGVQVTGLFSTRTIFYDAIVEHQEKDTEVVFRLTDGGKLRINKDLAGWAQAQMLIRKHAGLSVKPVEFSYPRK